jgi:hypothetical protein
LLYRNLHRAGAAQNGLEQHMKSLGLALTLFILTGALAALDLSGAHRVENANPAVGQPTLALRMTGTAATAAADTDKEEAAADDDDDDTNSEIINAFLVTPRSTGTTPSSAATTLRYD